MARLYTHLKVKWKYAPRSFDIGRHTYTPDFYLPGTNTYIEVKNFWGEYSRIRDANSISVNKANTSDAFLGTFTPILGSI